MKKITKLSDGSTLTTYKIGGVYIAEIDESDVVITESDEKEPLRPTPSKKRSVRMKELLNAGKTREFIKKALEEEGYGLQNFASEWFRLTK